MSILRVTDRTLLADYDPSTRMASRLAGYMHVFGFMALVRIFRGTLGKEKSYSLFIFRGGTWIRYAGQLRRGRIECIG